MARPWPGAECVVRIPANDNLERGIAELLTRPAGRPGHKLVVRYKSFLYHAESWKAARRTMMRWNRPRNT